MTINLLKSKHVPKSGVIKILLCHIFILEALNSIGFITTVIEFLWCLGPLQLYYEVLEGATREQPLVDRFLHKWIPKLGSLFIASNVAFITCGIFTDATIVCCMFSILCYLVIGSHRYGDSCKSTKQHATEGWKPY